MKFHGFFAVFILLFCGFYDSLFSQESQTLTYTQEQMALKILSEDIKLVAEGGENGGYHLYIRKKPAISSVMLTETTRDPLGKNDSYAYRAKEYNEINGDEIRYLDGKPLKSPSSRYSLISSTVVKSEYFEECFHIYIPKVLVYGYPWSRNGEIEIGKGTFINIRSFEKPYGDYSGKYFDSPFMFDMNVRRILREDSNDKKSSETVFQIQDEKTEDDFPPLPEDPVFEDEIQVLENPVEPEKTDSDSEENIIEEVTILSDNYNPLAGETFKEISEGFSYSKGPQTITADIMKILDEVKDKNSVDVVFAIDATGSMKNDIQTLQKDLVPSLLKEFGNYPDARFGLLFYRDYGDTFNYDGLPVRFFSFTNDLNVIMKNLNSIKIYGIEGGDIPEAVYEALYASVKYYNWRSGVERKVVLIGDAEPHPTPRKTGKYSKDFVLSLAEAANVKINAILLPND